VSYRIVYVSVAASSRESSALWRQSAMTLSRLVATSSVAAAAHADLSAATEMLTPLARGRRVRS